MIIYYASHHLLPSVLKGTNASKATVNYEVDYSRMQSKYDISKFLSHEVLKWNLKTSGEIKKDHLFFSKECLSGFI